MVNRLLDQIAAQCSDSLGQVFDCAANGHLWLFDITSEHDEKCVAKSNPFISCDQTIHPIWNGCVNIEAAMADRQEKREASRESSQLTITLPVNGIDLKTGWWAYVETASGDLLGGRVIKADRHKIIAVTIVVDTSKPVPFRPTLAELDDWRRGVQV